MGKNNKKIEYYVVRQDFENKGYKLLSKEYLNKRTKMKYICNKHKSYGEQWNSYESIQKDVFNCDLCKKENRVSPNKGKVFITEKEFKLKHFEKYKKKLFDYVGNEYILVDIFKKSKKVYLHLIHTVCGSDYIVEQYKFFNNKNRCQNNACASLRRRLGRIKSNEQFLQEVAEYTNNEYVPLNDYNGEDEKITFLHLKCNNTFEKTPHNFFKGQLCMHCNMPKSKGEQIIADFLDSHNIKYIFQKKFKDLFGDYGYQLSYDFYLPELNKLIEYQGNFHNTDFTFTNANRFELQQLYDERKRSYAIEHKYDFLEIWHFDDIEKMLSKNILKKAINGED